MLDLAWGSRPPGSGTLPWYCDVSQCASRSPWGSSIGCLTTSSRFYDFSRDCVINGLEAFQLQGFPATAMEFEGLSAAQLFNLSGEGMSCPCVGMVMLAVFLNPLAPWWVGSGEDRPPGPQRAPP